MYPPNFTSTIHLKLFEDNNFTRTLTKADSPIPCEDSVYNYSKYSHQTTLTQTDAWRKEYFLPYDAPYASSL